MTSESWKNLSREILKDEQAEPQSKNFRIEDFHFETESLDCSSLSGYVENALLASANNTLDRKAPTKISSLSLDSKESSLSDTSTDDGRKSGLCVQYVTYDFIAKSSADGLSSDGSSGRFDSDENINDQRKSDREEIVSAFRQNSNGNNNNGTLERYDKSDKSLYLKSENIELNSGKKSLSRNDLNHDDGQLIEHQPDCLAVTQNNDEMKAKDILGRHCVVLNSY